MAGRELALLKERAIITKEQAEKPVSIVAYERVADSYYSFTKAIDADSYIRMDETSQDYQESEFVHAEFDPGIPDAKRDYYLVAAGCGFLTATLSSVRLSDLVDLKGKMEDSDVEKYVIFAARAAGYRKKDYKGAVQYILKTASIFVKTHMPDQVKEYLGDLSSNPKVTGVVFSIITQFTGLKYQVNAKGKVQSRKVPSYYVIGSSAAEKIFYGILYWFFALGLDAVIAKKAVIDEQRIPKTLIEVLKSFVDVPLFNEIPKNIGEAERMYSEWLRQMFEGAVIVEVDGAQMAFNLVQAIKSVAVEAIEESVPVLLNECLFRGFYFIRRLSVELKAKEVSSFADLNRIDPHDVLPFNNQIVSKMAVIASGCFMAADIGCAAIKVLVKKKGENDKKFIHALISEVNIAGVGRFVLAVGADSKYWIESVKVLFVRKQKTGDGVVLEDLLDADSNTNAVFSQLSIDARQARLLYCLESFAVQEDIKNTKSSKAKSLKKKWLDEWQSQIVKGLKYEGDDFFNATKKEIFDYLRDQKMLRKNQRWIYLVTMELALFKAYKPIGSEFDRAYSRLKYDDKNNGKDYLTYQNFVTEKEWHSISRNYDKCYRIVSGSANKMAWGVGITAAVIALTGGLATIFAPQIAVLLAGEAVAGLHGAALTSASLAFVGGGAVAAGGGGMAAGAAIITGGGALLGAAGSGSASMIAMMAQADPGIWARQGAKLATYCTAILHDILLDDHSVEIIHSGTLTAITSVKKMIADLKQEETDLDKEVLELLRKYLSYLERTEKIIGKVAA